MTPAAATPTPPRLRTPWRRAGRLAAVAALALTTLCLAGSAKRTLRSYLVECLAGKWTMKQTKGYPWMLLVIRQEANQFPSIWVGKLDGGAFVIDARDDDLAQEVKIQSTGSIKVRVTHVPRRDGLEELFPAGVFVTDLKNKPVTLEFTDFKGWKKIGDAAGRADGVYMQSECVVTLAAMGKEVKLPATVESNHRFKMNQFSFTATFTIKGADFGLTGAQAGPMQARLKTITPGGQVPDVKTVEPDLPLPPG